MRPIFAETDLHSLYYEDVPISKFEYFDGTRQDFIDIVNILLAAPSLECVLKKCLCLKAKATNLSQNCLSVRVNAHHRLEVRYSSDFTELTIICLSRVLATQSTT